MSESSTTRPNGASTPSGAETAGGTVEAAQARRIVDAAIGRYIAGARARVPGFVDRHFGVRGALRLHRRAVGLDLARAPANVLLAPPQLALGLAGWLAGKAGRGRTARWLAGRRLVFPTSVAREIDWLVHAELLRLPYVQGGRRLTRDAVAEEIMADARMRAIEAEAAAALARHGRDPAFREALADKLAAYTGTRAAAAEITAGLVSLATGATAFQQLTPGALGLGPALAGALAYHGAVAGFPLGAAAGALWYGVFPPAPTLALGAAATGGLMLGLAVLTAFAGIVADPAQRRLGLHARRLNRLIDAIEADLNGRGPGRFVARDHYVARLLDLVDILRAAARAGG